MARDLDQLLKSLILQEDEVKETACWRPSADVVRTRRGWLIKVELAGVRPEDFSVHLGEDSITVSGVRRDFFVEEGHSIHSMEIAYSSFQREFVLPCKLDAATLSTDYRFGILLIFVAFEAEADCAGGPA